MELPTFKKCDNKLFESIALPQGDQELIKCKNLHKSTGLSFESILLEFLI